MANDNALTQINCDKLIPLLIQWLWKNNIPDIVLYSTMWICQIIDLNPQNANKFSNLGGLKILISTMQNI